MEKMRDTGLIDAAYVKTYVQKRDRQVHKGNCGKLLIVAGSCGMGGAAVLCARGALRTGAGLVQVSAPQELWPVIHTGVMEATCLSRRTSDWDLNSYQAVAIGPGLGVKNENQRIIEHILMQYRGTVVLDADALNHLAEDEDLMALAAGSAGCGRKGQLIITPHPGEAARLLGCSTAQIAADRVGAAQALANKLNAVAVLKGAGTIVAAPSGETYTNTTGNPGMATGGSGDVLTGMIAALLGQGLGPLEAACCGVYLHGLAGDLGAGYWGEYSLMASDIADSIALAIRQILEGN
ncbi:MAG: NAD(P)H-hydrate dehydratase [Firmicutes bacterium]|nr:NAD(P)H-hydrate dehydratase [Bacillota bacterium]